jgi:hypothetical protein
MQPTYLPAHPVDLPRLRRRVLRASLHEQERRWVGDVFLVLAQEGDEDMILTEAQEMKIYAAVRILRAAEPTEPIEVPLCIWCTSAPVDPAQNPYCSAICAICAENDNVD